MNNSEDKLEKLIDSIYINISKKLTDEEISELEMLDLQDPSGVKSEKFLISKFPELFKIIQDEVEKFKQGEVPS